MKQQKRYLLVVLLISCFYNLKAQDTESFYIHYLTDNYYLLHPALAGGNSFKIRLTARRQWLNETNAPSFETFTANGRINENNGAGIILLNDSNGNNSQQGFFLSYAYHILLEKNNNYLNQFSFGITTGFIEHQINEKSFIINDPIILGDIQSNKYYNLDFGFAYVYKQMHLQLTLKDFLGIREQKYDWQNDIDYDKKTRIILSGGYFFGELITSRNFYYEASTLLQYNPYNQEKRVDINFKAYYNFDNERRIWGGISAQNSFGIKAQKDSSKSLTILTPFIGVESENLLFSYVFGTPISSVSFTTGNFHQVGIGYNFKLSNRSSGYYIKSIL